MAYSRSQPGYAAHGVQGGGFMPPQGFHWGMRAPQAPQIYDSGVYYHPHQAVAAAGSSPSTATMTGATMMIPDLRVHPDFRNSRNCSPPATPMLQQPFSIASSILSSSSAVPAQSGPAGALPKPKKPRRKRAAISTLAPLLKRTKSGQSSDYRGVIWDSTANAWRTKIKLRNRTWYLGVYKNEHVAARGLSITSFLKQTIRLTFYQHF